jgi:hypothetical protein
MCTNAPRENPTADLSFRSNLRFGSFLPHLATFYSGQTTRPPLISSVPLMAAACERIKSVQLVPAASSLGDPITKILYRRLHPLPCPTVSSCICAQIFVGKPRSNAPERFHQATYTRTQCRIGLSALVPVSVSQRPPNRFSRFFYRTKRPPNLFPRFFYHTGGQESDVGGCVCPAERYS